MVELSPYYNGLKIFKKRVKYHHSRVSKGINNPIFPETFVKEYLIGTGRNKMPDIYKLSNLIDDTIDPELASMMQALRSQYELFSQIRL
ncbi:hypothetical protein [Niallia sp. FSL R7-0271]|uniref:hypothetical protein n=1 Tax=Niallia sp. FSL R7-0271 TaxID=2921678 RepID=UPI0030F59C0E